MRSLITNGTVVTALGSYEADVLVDDGTIVQIGRDLAPGDAETIDASGKYVMPGAIDVHTHLDTPWGTGYTTVDDWRAGSIGAACGGTTTVVDFALQTPGASLKESIDGWHAKAEGKSVIDYGFHAMVMDLNDQVMAEIPQLIDNEGIPSFKVFMAYKGIVQADDETLLKTMITANEHGGLLMVHAENGDAIQVLQDNFAAAGDLGVEFWPRSRPPELETEAAHRAITLAGLVDAPLYIVHISTGTTVEEVAPRARARRESVGRDLPAVPRARREQLPARRRREVGDGAPPPPPIEPGAALAGPRGRQSPHRGDRPLGLAAQGLQGSEPRRLPPHDPGRTRHRGAPPQASTPTASRRADSA